MLSFPSSPRTGQSYAAPNGQIYVWDGVKWIGTSVSGGSGGTTTTITNNIENPFTFNVAADDSTQREIANGELIKFIGAGTVTTSSDAEGYITITGSGGGGASTGDITFSTNNISAPVGADVNVKTANNGSGDAGDVNLTAGTGSVNNGVVRISTAGTYEWQFDNGGILTVPGRITLGTDAGIYGLGDFIGLLPANTSSAGLEIDGVNDAILAAMRDVTIRANAGSPWKNWTFNTSGTLELPGGGLITTSSGVSVQPPGGGQLMLGDPMNSLTIDTANGTLSVFGVNTLSGSEIRNTSTDNWLDLDLGGGNVGLKSTAGGVSIIAEGSGQTLAWVFHKDNYIQFPDATVQSTAFTGTANIARNIESENDVNITVNLTDSTKRIWRFGEDGNLTFPDGTNYSGKSITLPTTNGVSNSVSWTFSDVSIGSDTVRLEWNLLTTKQPDWWLGFNDATANDDYFHFSSINQSIGFAPGGIEGGGLLTFGTIAHGGAGSANDIELTSISGDVYIRTANNYWKFGSDGYAWFPNFLGVAGDMTVNNIVTGSVSGDFKGSLFGDDSTKIVDAVENKIYATEITGTIIGAPNNADTGIKIRVYAGFTYFDQTSSGNLISVYRSPWTEQVQIGWTITFYDGTTRVITGINSITDINNSQGYEFSFANSYASSEAFPITIHSPDYDLASSQPVKINSNGKEWNFDENGITTLPSGVTFGVSEDVTKEDQYYYYLDNFRYTQETELIQVEYRNPDYAGLNEISRWEVNGTNAQYYVERLQDIWDAQNASTLLVIPAISSSLYNSLRVNLQSIKSSYDTWQASLENLKISAGDKNWTFKSDGIVKLSDTTGIIYVDETSGTITIADAMDIAGMLPMPSTSFTLGGTYVCTISTGQWMGPGRGDNANPAWVFDRDANFKIPGNITSNSNINVEINLTDSTKRIWSFGEDGNLTIPGTIANSEGTVDFQLYNDNFRFNTYNQFGGATYIEGQPDYLFLMGNQSTLIGANGNSWDFTAEGNLHIPGDIRSDKDIVIEVNLFDSTLRRWQFGEDGIFNTPGDIIVGGNVSRIDGGDLTVSASASVYINSTFGSVYLGTNADTDSVILGSKTNSNDVAVLGDLQIITGVYETFSSIADATGVVTHNCANGHIFYHTSPDANWTVNITNLNATQNRATSITCIISQGGTGYYPNALQIAGAAQTINWQGNTTPTPSTNRTDVVTFSILNTGSGYVVLGQLTGF